MATQAYGAGIKHAQVKEADGTIHDLEAVVTFDGSFEIEETEIKGDDEVKVTFYSNQKASITLEANAITIGVIEAITGTTLETITGPPTGDGIALGTASETNPPFVEIFGQIRAKAADNTVATIDVTFHKVQLKAPSISATGGSEYSMNCEGVAYPTANDIEDVALGSKRIATVAIMDEDTTPA